MIEALIESVKPLKVQKRDFALWKANPITQEFFRDIQRALFEDFIRPKSFDPHQSFSAHERYEGAKQTLLSLEGWSPRLIDDEDTPNDN